MAPRTKTPEAPHADADDATATADATMRAAAEANAKAKQAVQGYCPQRDYRVWQRLAGIWRQSLHDACEIASGLANDGRLAELPGRLQRMLQERLEQEPGEVESAIAEFSKAAREHFQADAHHDYTRQVAEQIETLERSRAEAREANLQRERELREQRAAELEREAERLRQGPVRPASFIAIPAV
jgi:hypothetical protein